MDNMGVWLSPRQNNGRSRTNKLGKFWSVPNWLCGKNPSNLQRWGPPPSACFFNPISLAKIQFVILKPCFWRLLYFLYLFMYIFTAAKSKSAKSKWSSRHFLLFTARANVSRFSARSLMFQHPFLVYISVLADQIRVSAGCPSVWIISQIIFHLVMFQNKKNTKKSVASQIISVSPAVWWNPPRQHVQCPASRPGSRPGPNGGPVPVPGRSVLRSLFTR